MNNVLAIERLTVNLTTHERSFDVLSDVSLTVAQGEILALVGESGSGKSMTALSIMRLLPEPVAEIAAGSIRFGGMDLASADEATMRTLRGNRIGLIFQEPMTSLNPTMRVGPQVAEVLELHKGLKAREARARVEEIFALVRIPDPKSRYDNYPHQMSGGMRQRVMIAIALACDPELLIADEPTTALDVTTQSQILDTLRDLQAELGKATILITHDLAVVAETANRVAVMYAGRIIEQTTTEQLFATPHHPYTVGLLQAIPRDEAGPGGGRSRLMEIPGSAPALWNLSSGCAFAPRCSRATTQCSASRPALVDIQPGHQVACWHPVMEAAI